LVVFRYFGFAEGGDGAKEAGAAVLSAQHADEGAQAIRHAFSQNGGGVNSAIGLLRD